MEGAASPSMCLLWGLGGWGARVPSSCSIPVSLFLTLLDLG